MNTSSEFKILKTNSSNDMYDSMVRETIEALRNPQVGDTFHEMYSFYMFILKVEEDLIITMEAHPPCEVPRDGKIRYHTKESFLKSYMYKDIPGSWLMLGKKNADVSDWLNETNLALDIIEGTSKKEVEFYG